ncbi:hypothetical protein HOLleu_05118 [Holothuria leucospilota]|uniref:Uncharacterized protein n=1 Tax=Holothuria leucospilota TaxID=206669 RepID=A0A9Q1CK64_HOLLE|nr:hypothetical protein HOLleu_05118 [Holothuria leucospilota]
MSISLLRQSLNKVQFQSAKANQTCATTSPIAPVSSQSLPERRNDGGDCGKRTPSLSAMDLYWFYKLKEGNQPLHAGFVSRYIKDPLPIQRICCMDPISSSPTNNDVVRETMVRTMNVAKETGQDYAVVTYDLAIATKAYSIQALETPLFDKLLIMLGNFHTEMAFYGAVGTFMNECGIEFILTESHVLAEKSIMGFIKGKFYNRCKRIHELLANVFEQKLYERFLTELTEKQKSFQLVMDNVPSDPTKVEAHLSDQHVFQHLVKYEAFFSRFWSENMDQLLNTGRSIFSHKSLTTRVEEMCEDQRCRWRTKIDYSRSAVGLSIEQTINRDAASQMRGIVAFRSSENAIRRWSVTMAQRAMAVTELKTFAGIHLEEDAANQCR